MKRKYELIGMILLFGSMAPLQASARNCELPHEKAQVHCGGELPDSYDPEREIDASKPSAIEKARSASDVLKAYREKGEAYSALVQKADDDYRAYVESKR